MNRRKLVASQGVEMECGCPCPHFTPDFSSDNMLYQQFDSLNEVSVAQSESNLKDIINYRLRPVSLNDGLSASDNVIMDNIIPKTMENNQLLAMAHDLEDEILNDNTE